MIVGRWKRSTMRDATMPITPGCQPSRAEHDRAAVVAVESSGRRPAAIASSRICFSIACRSRFCCSRYVAISVALGASAVGEHLDGQLRVAHPPAGVEPRGEQEADVVAVELLPGRARPIRSAPGCRRACDAFKPAEPEVRRGCGSRRPAGRRRRSSPAPPARSLRPGMRGTRRSRGSPAAHRLPDAPRQLERDAGAAEVRVRIRDRVPSAGGRCVAVADGRVGVAWSGRIGESADLDPTPRSCHSWWSVTIRSTPRSRATFAGSIAVTPQSTVTISFAPLVADLRERLGVQAVAFVDAVGDVVVDLAAEQRIACQRIAVAVMPSTS